MHPSTGRRLMRGAALAAAAATLSCGRGGEAVPAGAAPRTRTAAPAPSSTAPYGEAPASGDSAALPQDFPPDVPSYPGASFVSSSRASEQGLLFAFQSKDDPEKVFEFYREKLAEQGWHVKGEMSSADQRMLIAAKGDRKASVLVSASERGETEIALTLTYERG